MMTVVLQSDCFDPIIQQQCRKVFSFRNDELSVYSKHMRFTAVFACVGLRLSDEGLDDCV